MVFGLRVKIIFRQVMRRPNRLDLVFFCF